MLGTPRNSPFTTLYATRKAKARMDHRDAGLDFAHSEPRAQSLIQFLGNGRALQV